MKISNKKAYFDYEILDTFEAGIVLVGSEVKSLRQQNANLKGSFIKIYGEDVMLQNMHIGAYKAAGQKNHEVDRNRKLLLHKQQIYKLIKESQEAGKTIIALEVYTKGTLIKVKIGVAKGKKKHDKRSALKDKQAKIDANRSLKNYK